MWVHMPLNKHSYARKKKIAYRLENAPKQCLLQHIRLFESMRLQYLCQYARVYASYGHMA
jgi:hypothetical protein